MKDTAPSSWTRATLAKLAGVGAESLRFYEQQGLIEKPARNEAGYRIYDGGDLERLQFIRRAQDLGFSLQDIKQLLQLTGNIKTPRKTVRDFAEARLVVIRRKISDLQAMEKSLSRLVAQCSGKGALQGCPIAEFIGGQNIKPHGETCHE